MDSIQNNWESEPSSTGSTFNNQSNTNFSGLDGLGSINNKSMSFKSSTFESQGINPNCLIVDQGKFNTLDSYYTYLRQWFNNTGIVNVQDATDSVKTVLNYQYMFDISFPNSSNETNAVIACYDINTAKRFLNNCRTGKFSTPALMFCFYYFNEADKRIAMNNNIELVGIDEMYDLNNAITSVFGGLSLGNTLVSKLQKALREKFKGQTQHTTTDVQSDLNEVGDNLMRVISDGFDQLKGSVVAMLASVGAGKMSTVLSSINNPFETQNQHPCNVPEQSKSNDSSSSHNNYAGTMEKVYGATDLAQPLNEGTVNLNKEAFSQSDEQHKPTVTLTKTNVQTTDNVVEPNNSGNVVSTAEDFLKIN